jgi:dihydrofolate reductase
MTAVVVNLSMSLDGFVADVGGGVGRLVDWYRNGDVPVPTAVPDRVFHTSPASAEYLRELFDGVGALLVGRRVFELTGGGDHPAGVPLFVLTHRVPDGWPPAGTAVTFVTDGLANAVFRARAAAGGGFVGVGSASVARQCLAAGLLDEIRVDLVPVLLGGGVRLFDLLPGGPVTLTDPAVMEGAGVTHLHYRIKREEG